MMDFVGPKGECSINNYGWQHLPDLAKQYGWTPAGVSPPDEPEEEEDVDDGEVIELNIEDYILGEEQQPELADALRSLLPPGDGELAGYFANSGQRISDEDALALAAAPERALPDLPGHDALAHKTVTRERLPGERFIPSGVEVSPQEFFSGPDKKAGLGEFIAFCRQGGFAIW